MTALDATATLHARTIALPDPGDLLARQPEAGALAWVRRGEGLVGWGTALRVPLGAGSPITRAGEVLTRLATSTQVDDDVEAPGTGLVAFVSCTFDPAASGSVLVVPRVVIGRRGGRAWATTVGVGTAPPEPALGPVHAAPDRKSVV